MERRTDLQTDRQTWFKNWFEFYSYSWKSIVFYVSFNSGFWYFGIIFGFLGPERIIFGPGKRLEKFLGVYSYILTIFVFWILPYSCSICCLDFFLRTYGGTEGQTDGRTDLLIEAPTRSLTRDIDTHWCSLASLEKKNLGTASLMGQLPLTRFLHWMTK